MELREEWRSAGVLGGAFAILLLVLFGSSHRAARLGVLATSYREAARIVAPSPPSNWPGREAQRGPSSRCEPELRMEDEFGIVRRNHDEMVRCDPREAPPSDQAVAPRMSRGMVL